MEAIVIPPTSEKTEAGPTDLSMADLRKMAENNFEPVEAKPVEPKVEAPAAAAEKPAAETTQPASEPVTQETHEPVPAGVQKRIDKAIAKQREAERKLAEAEAKLSAQGTAPAKTNTETVQPKAEGKPDPTKFTDWDAYQEALIDWKADQRDRTRAQEAQQRQQQEHVKTMTESWHASEATAKQAHPDYVDRMAEVNHIQVPPALQRAILLSDHKAELAYALATAPAELERIVALPPERAILELGMFAGKMAASKTESPKPKTSAAAPLPKPPASVGGSGAAAPAVNLDTCDMRTFKREARKLIERD
jgi:hypothetical protein